MLEESAMKLAHLLIRGFEKEMKQLGNENAVLLFSGGLDSTVLARLSTMVSWEGNITLCTLGTEEARDLKIAEKTAEFFNLDWREIVIDEKEVKTGALELLDLIPDLNFLELSYELPLYLCAHRTEENVIITGQGADELFGGYAKYREAGNPMKLIEKDRWRLFTRTLPNEKKIALEEGKVLVVPYLTQEVVDFASILKVSMLLGEEGHSKIILRETARVLGLPEIFCSRPKLAAQYGSGISKVLRKLKKKGELGVLVEGRKAIHEPNTSKTNINLIQ